MAGSILHRRRASGWTAAMLIVALGVPAVAGAAAGEETPTYERDVKPLFARRCTICHSRKNLDDADVSAGLALDSYEAALAGTGEHTVIEAGKPTSSELFRRLNDPDEERRMPLSEKPLTEPQRDLVRRWIEAGAPRGVALATTTTEAESKHPERRIVRTLDAVVPTEAKAPPGLLGVKAGDPLTLALKVGPLPPVTALAFRDDGRQLAVGTFGAVVVWDLAKGKPALILNDIPGQVHALAYHPDGTRLAVGAGLPARSGSARVYALPEGSLVRDLPGHGDVVLGLAFSPDGQQLASASFDQTVRLWDIDRIGEEAKEGDSEPGLFHGHSDFVYDVAFSPDGASLLTVSKDRSVKRIDVATLKEQRTYSDHNDDVLALAVHPSGTRFVTAGNEPQVRWWGLDDVKPAMKVSGHSGPVHQLAFNGDGTRLISAGADGSVRLWDGSTGAMVRPLPGATEWQYSVAISRDGLRAAAGGWDGQVRLWDADAARLRITLLQAPATDTAATEWLSAVPDGFVAASESLRPLIRWQASGKEIGDTAALVHFLDPDEVSRILDDKPADSAPTDKKK